MLAFTILAKSRNIFAVKEECSDLKHDADKAADAYFPVMTEWAVGGARDEGLRQEARLRAGAFRRSLDWLINCYQRVTDSLKFRRRLDDAVQMKHLVENDISTLNRYAPDSDNAQPE
jgi:hypothetical protein